MADPAIATPTTGVSVTATLEEAIGWYFPSVPFHIRRRAVEIAEALGVPRGDCRIVAAPTETWPSYSEAQIRRCLILAMVSAGVKRSLGEVFAEWRGSKNAISISG